MVKGRGGNPWVGSNCTRGLGQKGVVGFSSPCVGQMGGGRAMDEKDHLSGRHNVR